MEITKIMHLGNFSGIYRHDTKTFIKYRKESDIIRKFKGISISTDILNKLRKLGCQKITILLKMANGEEKAYTTDISRWWDNGIIFYHGSDYQRVLTINQLEGAPLDLSGITWGSAHLTKQQQRELDIINKMKDSIKATKGAGYYGRSKEEA
jgi:hypothetical protein